MAQRFESSLILPLPVSPFSLFGNNPSAFNFSQHHHHPHQAQQVQQILQTSDPHHEEEESKFLRDLTKGLECHVPELIEEGEGGSYLLRNGQGKLVGVFKPSDEDPYSPRNPKLNGRAPLEIRRGILPGEAAVREVAAYLLDHQNFAGVPLTLRIRIDSAPFQDPVEGSVQRYELHDFASWDIGPGDYQRGDVQRIALLDLRLLNTDRHGGNILVRRIECSSWDSNPAPQLRRSDGSNSKPKTVMKLIPIDHGMCLPDSSINPEELFFEWETWPQAKCPFEPFVRRYVEEIDLWSDVQILQALGLREECIRMMIVTGTLVKVTVARGFSPVAIAQLMRRVAVEFDLDQLVPDLSGPAVLSWLLFRISAWVDANYPQKSGRRSGRRGSAVGRSGAESGGCGNWNQNPPRFRCPLRGERPFLRQNSAPVIFLP